MEDVQSPEMEGPQIHPEAPETLESVAREMARTLDNLADRMADGKFRLMMNDVPKVRELLDRYRKIR
jgi:hypothetical protein